VGAFGEKLRQRREQRGLSLDAISNTTKISTRMLRAIEEEHFDQLPGGVFNKGFVRAYARHVGLNEEETVGEYLDALRESHVQSQAILPNFRASGRTSPPVDEPIPVDHATRAISPIDDAPTRIAGTETLRSEEARNEDAHDPDRRIHEDRRITARRSQDRDGHDRHIPDRNIPDRNIPDRNIHESRITEAVLPAPNSTGFEPTHPEVKLDQDFESLPPSFLDPSREPEAEHPLPPRQIAASMVANHASNYSWPQFRWEKLALPLLVISLVFVFWAFHRHNQNAAAAQPTIFSQPAPVPTPTTAAAVAPVATEPKKVSPVAATPSPFHPAVKLPDANTDPPARHSGGSKPAQPVLFTLVIRANQTSWIAISADGQLVARETLFAPAQTSVRASREITVRAGNSAGVSFSLNHHDISAPGSPGEARTYTFDSNGLRDSAAAQAPPTTR